MNDLGSGMLDPRPFYNWKPGAAPSLTGNSSSGYAFSQYQVMGLYNNNAYVDYVPASISSNGIYNTTVSTGNTPGGVVTIGATGAAMTSVTITAPETGTSTSLFVIDGSTSPYISYGQSGQVNMWNPGFGTGRCLSVFGTSNLDSGYTFAGRDMYGYKMTETIIPSTTSATNGTVGRKAWKYLSAIAASTTITSTGIQIGYSDTYGFPGALPYVGAFSLIQLSSNAFTTNVFVALSSAQVVLASSVTATSTTADVRGTYASTTASNSNVRLQILQQFTPLQVSAVGTQNSTGVFGNLQFSSV
jgi:hypothetical protein